MEITIPILAGFSLKISDLAFSGKEYPTAKLKKGFLLLHDGQELAEEGVGFGVPVLMRGSQAIFPGQIELSTRRDGPVQVVAAKFSMNLEEQIARSGVGTVKSRRLYTIKNSLAALIRRIPRLRGLLTRASNTLRWMFKWETTFEEAGFSANVNMAYIIDSQSGIILIEVDATELPKDGVTALAVMNEQGAHHFDQYRDASGILLRGDQIGCWDEVTAEWGSFVSEPHGLTFTLRQLKGARLFRGRELIGSRLAWSGFGYSFPPTIERTNYQIKIERL